VNNLEHFKLFAVLWRIKGVGIFGNRNRKAVVKFQESKKLEADRYWPYVVADFDSGYVWLPYEYALCGMAIDWWTFLKKEYVITKQFGFKLMETKTGNSSFPVC
jgi:hypothetical protein